MQVINQTVHDSAAAASVVRDISSADQEMFPKTEMSLTWIAVDSLYAEPAKPSKAFCASVAQHGVLTPLLVTRRADGALCVSAGRRRLAAARVAKLHKVPAMVVTDAAGEISASAFTLIENLHRSRNVASELRALRALANRGLTDDELQGFLGLPKRDFAKLSKLLALLPGWINVLEAARMSPTTAAVIASLNRFDQETLLATIEVEQRVTLDAAKSFRMKTRYGEKQLSFLVASTPPVEVPKWQ